MIVCIDCFKLFQAISNKNKTCNGPGSQSESENGTWHHALTSRKKKCILHTFWKDNKYYTSIYDVDCCAILSQRSGDTFSVHCSKYHHLPFLKWFKTREHKLSRVLVSLKCTMPILCLLARSGQLSEAICMARCQPRWDFYKKQAH